MKARKENRILSIDESEKAFYLAEGYDLVEFNKETKSYDLIEPATGGKTYTIAEYNELVEENQSLKARLAEFETDTTNEFDRDAAKKQLTDLGIGFARNITNEKLQQLIEDATNEDGK